MARINIAPVVVARFFNQPKYNHRASIEAKRAIYDDVEHVELRFAGDSQKISVFPAHEPEPNATREAFNQVQGDEGWGYAAPEPVTYAMVFNKEYLAFKNGDAQEASGHALREMGLSQGKILELRALNIYTVEALAALDGPNLKRLGMGARDLKNSAQAFLDTLIANEATPAAMAALASENARLRAQLAQQPSGPTERIPYQDAADPLATPAPAAKALSQAEIDALAEQSMDVKQMSDEDLKAYIVNNTGKEPGKRLTRKALETQALAIAEA